VSLFPFFPFFPFILQCKIAVCCSLQGIAGCRGGKFVYIREQGTAQLLLHHRYSLLGNEELNHLRKPVQYGLLTSKNSFSKSVI
jgi:hypothetical protein